MLEQTSGPQMLQSAGGGEAVVLGVSNIGKVLARVFVSDLDAAVPLYEALAEARAERFGFHDVATQGESLPGRCVHAYKRDDSRS
jgi:hypothetical protein